jgi:hypothetical protein
MKKVYVLMTDGIDEQFGIFHKEEFGALNK